MTSAVANGVTDNVQSSDALKTLYSDYIGALNSMDFDAFQNFLHDEIILNGKAISRQSSVSFCVEF